MAGADQPRQGGQRGGQRGAQGAPNREPRDNGGREQRELRESAQQDSSAQTLEAVNQNKNAATHSERAPEGGAQGERSERPRRRERGERGERGDRAEGRDTRRNARTSDVQQGNSLDATGHPNPSTPHEHSADVTQSTQPAQQQLPGLDLERVEERRDRRSRDRYGRERRERQDRPIGEDGQGLQSAPSSDLISHELSNEPATPASPPKAEMPKVQHFDLPVQQLVEISKSSGLEWVNSNPERVAQVQSIIAAEPKPVHIPRERPPVVELDEGPLILVETRKDLTKLDVGV